MLTLLMATLQKPKLLLLDEHTAALDPKTAAKVLETTEYIVNKDYSGYQGRRKEKAYRGGAASQVRRSKRRRVYQ